MRLHFLTCAGVLCAAAPASLAQSGGLATPGMPARGTSGGATEDPRFASEFNPAIGLVLDIVLDHLDAGGGSRDDGFDFDLRAGEMTASAWVDPSAWAYAAVVYAGEEVALEEGVLRYEGFDGNLTLRGGRFLVDFGKQMQAHVHDLRTVERPAVLRTYLGGELAGDGLQMDNWFVAGDDTVVRYSIAAFGSLIGEGHGHDHGGDGEAEPFDTERKKLDELAFAARLTGFTDVGRSGTLQVGTSARVLPEFGLEAPGSTVAGGAVSELDNTVLGVDMTLGLTDETQTRSWTFGGELLIFTGDLGGELDDNLLVGDPSDDLVDVVDGCRTGFYVFADHAWDTQNSAGIQWSRLELPHPGSPDMSELELCYTRNLSEFQRLRLAVSHTDRPHEPGSLRLAVQWTAFLGPHSHGVNW